MQGETIFVGEEHTKRDNSLQGKDSSWENKLNRINSLNGDQFQKGKYVSGTTCV